jgi:REP element-mobilizing transposase RayT
MTYRPVHDPTHEYFVTATLLGWKRLFEEPHYAQIILDSLGWHRQNGRWALYAYVVMPSHVHAVVKPVSGYTISDVLRSFGSFTAHAILAELRAEARQDLLGFFSNRQLRDASKRFQVWRPMEAANVVSPEFLVQKVEYIHDNPVAENWSLVGNRADYAYSSACFYDRGDPPLVEVDNAWELLG